MGAELKYHNDWLLVFIDDTGHETFAGTHDYYGLGGCVVLGARYDWLKGQWREVRRLINGSPDAPLHAADTTWRGARSFAVLSQFFLDRSFLRIAATSTRKTVCPAGMHPAAPVMGGLHEHVVGVAELIPCKAIAMVVESSQRADAMLKEHFGELKLENKVLILPVEHWLMPKSAGEPGLEIADFIINAAGSQTRRYLKGQPGVSPDFQDVLAAFRSKGVDFR
jgi:hypothetical protein